MNRKGKAISNGAIYGLIGVFVIFAGLLTWAVMGNMNAQTVVTPTGNVVNSEGQVIAVGDSCGSAKTSTVTLNLKNGLNTTGSEFVNTSWALYSIDAKTETFLESGSDTTDYDVTVDCGSASKYRLKLIGGGTMNSRVLSLTQKEGGAVVDTDGSVVFSANKPSIKIGMVANKHALIEVRAYNEEARARMYAAEPSSDPTVYKTTGVTFTSVTDNATATSVAAGSSLRMSMELKNIGSTADYNDFGTLVMFDATNTYWDKVQQITLDNVELKDYKASLEPNTEGKKFSNYEYVFLIPQGKLLDGKTHTLTFDVLKSDGATGTDNLLVDFAVRTNYMSIDSYTVKTGAASDAATSPVVYPLFQTVFETQ